MGNFQFKHTAHPPGQICVIVDSPYSLFDKIPASVYETGTKVKVIGSKDLACSRPDAPKVTCSLVQFQDGRTDVYFSNNLKPVS